MKKISYWLSALLMLFVWSSCEKDNPGETPDVKFPKFLYATPADQSVDVLLDTEISAVYNTDIALDETIPVTVNDQQATVTVQARKLIFTIALEKNKTYQISIPKGAVKNAKGEAAEAVSFSFSTVADSKRYEAEEAALTNGAVVESALSGYSGTGYVNQKDGDISFKVTLPEEGKYTLSFRYSNGNSKKENDLVVNGTPLSTVVFDATNEWRTISVNKVSLKTGENTILIKKNWGWINLDYIEIAPAGEDIPFHIAANLVTPSASKEAVNVYEFLKENFGQKVISGAMANYSTGIEEAQWMFDNTGKWPALAGFDLINYTTSWGVSPYTQMTANVKNWWNENGLVSIMWHWRDPLKQSDEFYTEKTTFDVSKISDTNSEEYQAMITDIDAIAGYLKQFKEAGIPILWRPLHEAAGAWFWWGAKGAGPCKTLWKLMFDRLVHHHGLNNLIWVWTSDASDTALDWYPGDEYVDIIGMDIYPGENQHGSQYIAFDKVKSLYEGRKIVTLSECGSIPSIESMFEYGDTWSWFMPWNGDYTRSDSHNGATYFSSLLTNEKVITRDKMPSLKE